MANSNPHEEMILREFGHPVTVPFDHEQHQAYRDANSGYNYFHAPSTERLWSYYNKEYGKDSENYYTADLDYNSSWCTEVALYCEMLASKFEIRQPFKIHELGCAFGGKVATLRGRGHDATGSDINADAIKEGQDQKGNTQIFQAENIDFINSSTNTYDIIFGLHSIEHDPNLNGVLSACRDHLNDSGFAFFRVPNVMYIRALLDGFISHPWTDFPAHLHMLSTGYIGTLCDELHFEPLSVLTRTSFEVDTALKSHFGPALDGARIRRTWDFIFAELGVGMELEFVVTPSGSALARRHADLIARTRERVSAARQFELAVRGFLADLPYRP